jgi:hypothetical protein
LKSLFFSDFTSYHVQSYPLSQDEKNVKQISKIKFNLKKNKELVGFRDVVISVVSVALLMNVSYFY